LRLLLDESQGLVFKISSEQGSAPGACYTPRQAIAAGIKALFAFLYIVSFLFSYLKTFGYNS
jgi:hypothetical protein